MKRFAIPGFSAAPSSDRPRTPPPPPPPDVLAAADRLAKAVEEEFTAYDVPEDIATALFEYRRARKGAAG